MNTELQAVINVIRKNTQQGLNELEAVNIGSAYKTKDEIILQVSKDSADLRNFIMYSISLIEHLANGGNFNDFVDEQIDRLSEVSKEPYHPSSKEYLSKMLYELYPQIDKELELLRG